MGLKKSSRPMTARSTAARAAASMKDRKSLALCPPCCWTDCSLGRPSMGAPTAAAPKKDRESPALRRPSRWADCWLGRPPMAAVGGGATPEPKPAVSAGFTALSPSASGPPGGGALVWLGSSTFGAAGHPSASPDAWPESTLFRCNDTYTPYPSAANTAMIIRFFSEFMFVLLDETQRAEKCGRGHRHP